MELHPTAQLWTAVAGIFFIAGVTKGVVGLGLPTVSIALLSLAMPPAQAAAILIIPSLVTNLWQMVAGNALLPLAARLWPLLAGIVAGTLAAGMLAAPEVEGHGKTLLGVLLVLYGLSGLSSLRLRVAPAMERWAGPAAGVLTGAISSLTGVFVIPAVPYLQGLGLDKDGLVQALGMAFTVSTVALAIMLGLRSDIGTSEATLSIFALLPALAGMAIGQGIRQRLSLSVFRRCLFLGLIALGVHLLVASR
ncbi:MAG TPA: sulfite exporter TauE/SafE family protein [Noviherbaspirillum sp.]|jgi:uncharacterized membrane protein YfcA|uniref:sulfite exporter TauE/SafE family protein n=1 Tax=Noviherbaspirillum sp. TaxID=1926288 RepID=UPI002F9422C5